MWKQQTKCLKRRGEEGRMRSCKCTSYNKLCCISLKMFFSVSAHEPPTWDFVDHHRPTWALRTFFFSVLFSSALIEQLSLLVWKRLSSLPFYHRLQLQSPQVRLSRKGFITQYQAAYRFWGAVREPGLDATQQKWAARKNAQSCHGLFQQKVHCCCPLSLMHPPPARRTSATAADEHNPSRTMLSRSLWSHRIHLSLPSLTGQICLVGASHMQGRLEMQVLDFAWEEHNPQCGKLPKWGEMD